MNLKQLKYLVREAKDQFKARLITEEEKMFLIELAQEKYYFSNISDQPLDNVFIICNGKALLIEKHSMNLF